jgi:zinc protease
LHRPLRHLEPLGQLDRGQLPPRLYTREPEQLGERRVTVAKEGTTGYLKIAYHAPGVAEAGFFPMLVLDAVLTGAKGVNLWASFRTPPPQRSTRLYQTLVNTGLASSVNGGFMPTQHPFLYTLSLTATEGVALQSLEAAALAELERVRLYGVTQQEVEKARHQLRARFVFEDDSITNIGHQLGYFATIADWTFYRRIADGLARVTVDQVGEIAATVLGSSNRTVGWFTPLDDASAAPAA